METPSVEAALKSNASLHCSRGQLNQMIHLRQLVTKRKGSELRCVPFQSQLDSKLEGVGLEDLQPDMSSDILQWLLSQEKPLIGLTQKSC